MNFAMWKKALQVIPPVSKEEWDRLDVISKWLISTRAAVLIMTFISAALAGLFAWRDDSFSFLPWLALVFGLIMAHASNNIFNDYTDFVRGVDKDNYYRNIYGAQPIASGLMTKRQHLTYFAVTALIALVLGMYLLWNVGFSSTSWLLLGLGAFFLLFYTWPLKGLGLGEVEVAAAEQLRSGIEQTSKMVGVSGVFTMSASDHNGLDLSAFEMVRIVAGDWVIAQ